MVEGLHHRVDEVEQGEGHEQEAGVDTAIEGQSQEPRVFRAPIQQGAIQRRRVPVDAQELDGQPGAVQERRVRVVHAALKGRQCGELI